MQKIIMSLYGSLLILATLFVDCSNVSSDSTSSSVSPILGIRYFMQNSDKYLGTIIEVEGVVSQIIPAQNMVVLIDMEEYKECKVVTCALLRLPVFWEGVLPTLYDIVRVKGEVSKRDGKRLFIAKELKKIGQVSAKE